jgi:hypothetical protein
MDARQIRKLQSIDDFPDLLAYLRDELDWPVEENHFDDLTFDYTADELGIDEENAAKILEIKRLRPLDENQPWGIFFLRLEPKRLPVVALRRVLSKLSLKKRASANRADQAAWHHDDILFISNFGPADDRQLSFAHFAIAEDKNDLPVLKVLGWDSRDTKLHVDYIVETLRDKLIWPEDTSDADSWRRRWRDAFVLRHKEVVSTSREMAIRLAELARNIRDSILSVLEVESDKGPLRQIMETFKEALIHDLDEAGFADMYAQTIAYGLLSARIADPHGDNTVEHLGDHMRTNPFLRELMETFLDVGGRKRGRQKGAGLDFDELGVSEVVDLLDRANMEAVVRDFGDRNRQEDPVMHFYESFLHEYNKQLKVQRGVFYTPQPVVSYIVRSVHELLQTEFGLEDGLADITTWGQMLKTHPDMKLPPLTDEPGEKRTISPDEPFVQILDPATGTATFLVEVIDVIYNTMTEKWKQQSNSAKAIDALWNDYVPQHLLPRLHAYELMMAPYAIAHMKVGIKLAETGYNFKKEERARIYLTNALEPWSRQLPIVGLDALAHEAAAVNEIKRSKRFTVVIGNPPYAASSENNGLWINGLMETYKHGVRNEESQIRNLSDDYVKFLRLSQHLIHTSAQGLIGVITNSGFIDGVTFRDFRESVISEFNTIKILDLHGHGRRGTRSGGDENVFDIMVGTSISFYAKSTEAKKTLQIGEIRGSRTLKYQSLAKDTILVSELTTVQPKKPAYIFQVVDENLESEYASYIPFLDFWGCGNEKLDRHEVYGFGFKTQQDDFAIAFDKEIIVDRINLLLDRSTTEKSLRTQYRLCKSNQWSFERARKRLSVTDWKERIVPALYRPFDLRFTCLVPDVVTNPRLKVMGHLLKENIALLVSRQVGGEKWRNAFVSNAIADNFAVSLASKEGCHVFPLYPNREKGDVKSQTDLVDNETWLVSNLNERVARHIASVIELNWIPIGHGCLESRGTVGPEDIFNYIYSVFYSESYRFRYLEFLKRDFPRVPVCRTMAIFKSLSQLGNELVSVHLLSSNKINEPITKFHGEDRQVTKIVWTPDHGGTVWLDGKGTAKKFQPGTSGFRPVPEEVWNFHIGGYQVCEKWLKDRGPKKGNPGRMLTDEDIAHYHKIVIALTETIRIMAEIDEVIEAHGGWPGAFVTADDSAGSLAGSSDAYESSEETVDPDLFDKVADSEAEH